MGTILCKRISLITTLSETVGYKSGLALSSNEMLERLPEFSDVWDGDDQDGLRIRSENFEEMVANLLYSVGSILSLNPLTPGLKLHKKYGSNPQHIGLVEEIVALFSEVLPIIRSNQKYPREPIDLDPFIKIVLERYGAGIPIAIALDFVQSLQYAAHINPWSEMRMMEWKDVVELSNLFKSENLATFYGTFFDQRFIDYLNNNFADIDNIHWRQFEGLTAEYYNREGFHVEIGPGRNDGGIDVRIWPSKDDVEKPPAILVQCKRQKKKISKVIVKALWADIQSENAISGLIVTTNSLSPGAQKVSTARAYPIQSANRDTLREWITNMRNPHTGVFLGE